MNVMSFPESPSICPVQSLKDYLVRTAPLRAVDAQHMFIQLRQPHKSVSSQTLACWITSMMADAGMDTSMFCHYSTYSTWAASKSLVPRKCQWPRYVIKIIGPDSPPHSGSSIIE